MTAKVTYTADYYYNYKELLTELPDLSEFVNDKILLFKRKFRDERLRDHKLTGKMHGLCASSITDDIRIVYRWKGKNTVEFLAIGGHKKVYGKK